MRSVKTWRQAAIVAYIAAGTALPFAVYALATTHANLNAMDAAQTRLNDQEWRDHLASDKAGSATSAAGDMEHLETRPYSPAIDWPSLVERVMPSVVMISGIDQAKGDGSRNRAWLIPDVQTNQATVSLNRYRAWQHGWSEADKSREWYTRGAGFLIGDGRTVVTVGHLVSGTEGLRVKLASGDWRATHVVGVDYSQDVAVLRIDGVPGKPMPIAPAMPRQGQAVATIGAPEGHSFSLSTGIVSRYGDASAMFKMQRMLQIDSPIVGGHSGGVVFNVWGEAVGMISFGGVKSQLNQAVPIGRALAVADRLEHQFNDQQQVAK